MQIEIVFLTSLTKLDGLKLALEPIGKLEYLHHSFQVGVVRTSHLLYTSLPVPFEQCILTPLGRHFVDRCCIKKVG